MKVLIGCEFSQIVAHAFREKGFDAYSCDLLPTEGNSKYHYQADIIQVKNMSHWDLMVVHPPCTHLAVSGARWFKFKTKEQFESLKFIEKLLNSSIPHIALENPISIISSIFGKPSQIIQPWQFGHGETKSTCLWLKNLPLLKPTNIVDGRENKVHREPPGPDRWKNRSRTYKGIAEAMAEQWGTYLLNNGH